MIIDGKKVSTDKTFDVINPYTGQKVSSVPIASPVQIDQALRLSYEMKPDLLAEERVRILDRLCRMLKTRKRELAELITSESGLSLKDTLYEVDRVADVAFFSARVAGIIEKDTTANYEIGLPVGNPRLKVITEPFDLVVGITPFNHPMNQAAHKVLPCVAAGACMVLKPSSKTPLSALKLGELLLEAGLPGNMLNIITGVPAGEMVPRMIASPLVNMVTFTGGLEAGLDIARELASNGNALKRYVPELGGCSSLIVNDDADIALAAQVAARGCFGNSGQRCTAIRRLIVVASVAADFVDALIKEAEKITCGDPYDEKTDMGTVISEEAARMIQARVGSAISDCARLLLGNDRKGAIYPPTVLDNVSIESELVAKETFGPVGAVIRAKDIDDAIDLANHTGYRLAGAVMTRSREIAEKVSNALAVGQFSWNGVPSYRTEAAPFGGFGSSGNGMKEGVILAAEGMRRIRTFYEH
jgi:putative phosphonoacetaldehyde dehydrogenase